MTTDQTKYTDQEKFLKAYETLVEVDYTGSDNSMLLRARNRALFLSYAGSRMSAKDFLAMTVDQAVARKRPLWKGQYDPSGASDTWAWKAKLDGDALIWRSLNRWGVMPEPLSQSGLRVVLTGLGLDVSMSKWNL